MSLVVKPRSPERSELAILPGELVPELDDLYTEYVNELFEDPELPSLLELIKMYKFCPINRVAVELKSMRAIQAFGVYQHPDKKVVRTSSGVQTLTEWVTSNFQTMRSSLSAVIDKMFKQVFSFGYSVAEVIYSSNIPGHYGEWRIWKIKVLNPCRYNFAGHSGDWDRIIYRSNYQSHYPIPRRKLLHIYLPSIEDPENPLGDAPGTRGYLYYKARKAALRNWNNQLAKGVKGQTVVKGDSNDTVPLTDIHGKKVLDENNKPIPVSATKEAAKAFAQAKDGDVIGVDKQTEVQHFPGISGTGADYNLALGRYNDDIFMSYGVPKTILGEGAATLGQAGLNAGHRLIMDSMIGGTVEVGRQQFVEQIVRDLLNANFGIKNQDDYGEFKDSGFLSPEQAGMRITNLMSAMLQGVVDSSELEAINRIRVDCGISPISAEEFNYRQIQALMAQQQASYEAQQQQAQMEAEGRTEEAAS